VFTTLVLVVLAISRHLLHRCGWRLNAAQRQYVSRLESAGAEVLTTHICCTHEPVKVAVTFRDQVVHPISSPVVLTATSEFNR